jgi:putative hydrolase of the HAD superfamily
MAVTMMQLPRAMLIDMDDTILSAYGRPEIAWNKVIPLLSLLLFGIWQ